MPLRNLYVVLRVPPDATADMIRSAYRRLVKEHHPDYAGPAGAGRFSEITEAYRTLSDPALRAAHNDAIAHTIVHEPYIDPAGRWHAGAVEPLAADPIEIRETFYSENPSAAEEFVDWVRDNYTARRVPKSGRQRDMNLEVVLTPDEAATGGVLPVQLPAFGSCPSCGGSGRDWLSFCFDCGGTGARRALHAVQIRIPPMVFDNSVWEVAIPAAGLRLHVWIRIDPDAY